MKHLLAIGFLALATATPQFALARDALPQALFLACPGVASYSDEMTTQSSPGELPTATTSVNRTSPSSAAFRLDGDKAMLQLPSAIIPNLTFGGKSGWWPVDELAFQATEITGRIKINPISRPRFTINRRSGAIRISSLGGSFEGACQRQAEQNLF